MAAGIPCLIDVFTIIDTARDVLPIEDLPAIRIRSDPCQPPVCSSRGLNPDEMVAVSPDMGGANRTRHFAKNLNIPMAIIDKRRDRHNEAIAAHIIGDVENKVCLMFDDIIDTAGTICEASKLFRTYEIIAKLYPLATLRAIIPKALKLFKTFD